jgi:hypothetical protein
MAGHTHKGPFNECHRKPDPDDDEPKVAATAYRCTKCCDTGLRLASSISRNWAQIP